MNRLGKIGIAALCVVFTGAGGIPSKRASIACPNRTVAAIQQVTEHRDVPGFRAMVSSDTIRYLRNEYGEAQIDNALSLMMFVHRSDRPIRVVHERREGFVMRLQVKGDCEEEWRLVEEHGSWKLDLVEEYRAWNAKLRMLSEMK